MHIYYCFSKVEYQLYWLYKTCGIRRIEMITPCIIWLEQNSTDRSIFYTNTPDCFFILASHRIASNCFSHKRSHYHSIILQCLLNWRKVSIYRCKCRRQRSSNHFKLIRPKWLAFDKWVFLEGLCVCVCAKHSKKKRKKEIFLNYTRTRIHLDSVIVCSTSINPCAIIVNFEPLQPLLNEPNSLILRTQ